MAHKLNSDVFLDALLWWTLRLDLRPRDHSTVLKRLVGLLSVVALVGDRSAA